MFGVQFFKCTIKKNNDFLGQLIKDVRILINCFKVKYLYLYFFKFLSFSQDGFQELPDDGSTAPQDVPVYLEVTVPDVNISFISQCQV